MAPEQTRVAVVDIGTNSTRLLVADVADRTVTEIERRTRVTRLGRGVDLSGQLASDAIEGVCDTVAEYVALYNELEAAVVTPIATSAVRDASNGGAFIAELRERFDLSAKVLDGEQEALLTYLGATAGNPPAESTLVVDIGGGSTELIVGSGGDVGFHASLQAGVVRHSERHLPSDPPTAKGLEALAADVRGLVDAAVAERPDAHANAGIAVAGTPTSLAAVELGLAEYDSDRVHGHVLELSSIQHMLSTMAAMPLAEREQIPGLHADRAPTIVAGVVVLIEVMRAFGLDRVTVSEHDILYGVAIDSARRHA